MSVFGEEHNQAKRDGGGGEAEGKGGMSVAVGGRKERDDEGR